MPAMNVKNLYAWAKYVNTKSVHFWKVAAAASKCTQLCSRQFLHLRRFSLRRLPGPRDENKDPILVTGWIERALILRWVTKANSF